LPKFFQETEEKGIFLNSHYEAHIDFIQRPGKSRGRRKKFSWFADDMIVYVQNPKDLQNNS
jgi:hypothetical protein